MTLFIDWVAQYILAKRKDNDTACSDSCEHNAHRSKCRLVVAMTEVGQRTQEEFIKLQELIQQSKNLFVKEKFDDF